MLAPMLDQIEQKRLQLRISRSKLERVAQLSPNYYYQLQTKRYFASKETLASLQLALNRIQACATVDYSEKSTQINMLIRIATALICQVRGLDAEKIQQSDPSKRATQSEEWRLASRVRRDAWALVNSACGIAGADLARAAGVSRAAISLALTAVMDARDDPKFDQEMDRLERAITGGGW